jgi:adenosylcobinamide hydrolase
MMIRELSTGDLIHRYNKSIVIEFKGARKVLSTSVLNGGYNKNLKAVFNHDCNPGAGMACKLKAPTYEEHMQVIARELGLVPDMATGIGTAASMDNVSIKTEAFENLRVTAIVTGGVEVNGGRVGEPALYCENEVRQEQEEHGTINIILFIDCDLTEGAIARALVTCTEAKTATLQELMAGSNYSHGLATGSGTDGTIIICNADSHIRLTNAGKHSKLGELIGKSVKNTVKEALYLQTGLCPQFQHSILKRFKRYGVNEERIWEEYCSWGSKKLKSKAEFLHKLHSLERRGDLVALTSLYIHLLDQLDWDLLLVEDTIQQAKLLAGSIKECLGVEQNWIEFEDEKEVLPGLLRNYTALLADACGG